MITNSKAFLKLDNASYAWRNAIHRRNRRRANKWARVMWDASGRSIGMNAAKRRADPMPKTNLYTTGYTPVQFRT